MTVVGLYKFLTIFIFLELHSSLMNKFDFLFWCDPGMTVMNQVTIFSKEAMIFKECPWMFYYTQ